MILSEANVRVGHVSDANLLREIRCESLLDSPAAYGARYADVATQPLSYWKNLIRRRHYLLACTAVGAVGMVCVDRYEQAGINGLGIFSMFVRPEYRGTTVASELIAASKTYASQRGADALYLDVVEGNSRALSFYRREGFVEYGATREMTSDPRRQMVTMVCWL